MEREKIEKENILLHSCCGPCSTTAIFSLQEKYNITVCYYNPNIYPQEEYIKRKNEQIKLIKKINNEGKIKISIIDAPYNFQDFEKMVENMHELKEGGKRCELCFEMRLDMVAKIAKENKFNLFATTLTVSPHKNAELINNIGKIIAKKYNINYLETNFKKNNGYKNSIELSKKYELYRQNYCGCKYSIWF